jgi:hypothetical protein
MPTHGKGANIFANGFDLSPFLSSIDQTQTVDTAEVTTFTAQSKAYVAGQIDSTLSMSGYFDGVASGVDEVLSAALDGDSATVLTVAEGGVGTVGNRALVASGLASGYNITSSVSEAVQVSAEFQLDGSGIGNPTQQFLTPATFTRASAATLDGVDYATNAPRYTGGGLLVEEGTTNLLTNTDGALATYATPTAGITDAPGSIINFNNAIAFPLNNINRFAPKSCTALTIGSTYTFSCYVIMDDLSAPVVGDSAAPRDFAVTTTANVVSTNSNCTITLIGSNVYRVTCTFAAADASTLISVSKYATHSVKTFKVTGYQLELKSYPTSYAESGASAFVRAADALSVPRGQFAHTGWAYTGILRRATGIDTGVNDATYISLSIDGSNFYYFFINRPSQSIGVGASSGGTLYRLQTSQQVLIGQTYRVAITGNATVMKIAVDGVIVGTLNYVAPVGTLPASITFSSQINSIHAAVGTAGRALTDDELRDLSAGRPVNGIQYYSLNGDLNGREITSGTHRGIVLANGASITSASQNYTAVDNGGATSNGIIANLHITASDQSTIAKIQHSTDNVNWSDLVTFASIAAGRGAERKIVTGTVNRYLRATWSGTLGTRTVVITAARM